MLPAAYQHRQPRELHGVPPSYRALPTGWKARVSRSTGDTYFVNQYTGESTYDRPTGPAGAPPPAAPSHATPGASAEREAANEIMVTKCPVAGCNGLYRQTGDLHEGVPHYTNGTKHLYYRPEDARWYINSAFTPDKAVCHANLAVMDVALPMGEHSWQCYVDKKWQGKNVTTAVPTKAESAADAVSTACPLICWTVVVVVLIAVIVIAFVEDGYDLQNIPSSSCRSAMQPLGRSLKVVATFLLLDLAKRWTALCSCAPGRCCHTAAGGYLERWPFRVAGWVWSLVQVAICGWAFWCLVVTPLATPDQFGRCHQLDEWPMVYILQEVVLGFLQCILMACVGGCVVGTLSWPFRVTAKVAAMEEKMEKMEKNQTLLIQQAATALEKQLCSLVQQTATQTATQTAAQLV